MFAALNKKAAALTLAALTLGAGVTMNSGEAEARFGRKGIAAAGIIGALAVGAMAIGAANAHHGNNGYYAADPGYDYAPPAPVYAPQPVYYPQAEYYGQPAYYGHPAYGYGAPRHHRRHGWRGRPQGNGDAQSYAYRGPNCKLTRQHVWTEYGPQVQRVQVCR